MSEEYKLIVRSGRTRILIATVPIGQSYDWSTIPPFTAEITGVSMEYTNDDQEAE